MRHAHVFGKAVAWSAVLALTCGVAAYAGPGSDGSGDSRRGGEAAAGQGRVPSTRPQGFVILDESVVYMIANEPQQHLAAALVKAADKNYKGAAAELRIAGDYLKFQSSQEQGREQGKDMLGQEMKRLNKLAGKLEKGEQGGADLPSLQKEFGVVSFALAGHYQQAAEQALKSRQYTRAGYKLDSAALAFEQAIGWSGEQPKQETINVLNNAHKVASNLVGENMSLANQAAIGKGRDWYSGHQEGRENPQNAQAKREARQDQARQEQERAEAQTAGARSQAGNNPLLGTTKAEADNIAEHAQGIVDQLGKELQNCQSSFQQGGNQSRSQGHDQNGSQNGSSNAASNSGQRSHENR